MLPRRYGWRKPRRVFGAVIIDNLGLAIVYEDPNNDWPRQPRRPRRRPTPPPW